MSVTYVLRNLGFARGAYLDDVTALAEKWAKAAHYYNCCGPTEVRFSHKHFPRLSRLNGVR